jgi:hypothetical protein
MSEELVLDHKDFSLISTHNLLRFVIKRIFVIQRILDIQHTFLHESQPVQMRLYSQPVKIIPPFRQCCR